MVQVLALVQYVEEQVQAQVLVQVVQVDFDSEQP